MSNAKHSSGLVACCNILIELASRLLPPIQRREWKDEWKAEIWHRWQFLHHAGEWNRLEAFRLFRRCLGTFPDALLQFVSQDRVQSRFSEVVRSPWSCLGALFGTLLILASFTGGLSATRNLLTHRLDEVNGRLLFIWRHPTAGGGDKGLPSDVAPAWARKAKTLEGVSAFALHHQEVRSTSGSQHRVLVAVADPNLFRVLRPKHLLGKLPDTSGVVVNADLWRELFRSGEVLGHAKLQIAGHWYPVDAVLPRGYSFLTRQPVLYLIQPFVPGEQQMLVARAMPGAALERVDRELTSIAEGTCYYFFRGELRFSYLDQAAWIPLQLFGIAVLASALLVLSVTRVPYHQIRVAIRSGSRRSLAARVSFFAGKTFLALLFIFTSALEWSRSSSAILFASKDPASGPFILWLYILGTMGVLFWAVADQRARCRVCLRLLCFPVRIGCPGCLLLDWSGTELLCTEGHGVLHVPHMAPSWEHQPDHWISLDESWKALFVETGKSSGGRH